MERSNPFFSIVVPVYNAQAYIEDTIRSILRQSFRDFELILVDDCSQDDSLLICRQYAEKDHRIRIIENKVNSGASVARNKGLDNALGNYYGFVDSDDTIDERLLETIYNALVKSNADFLKFGVYEEYYSEKGKLVSRQKFSPGSFIINDYEDIKNKSVELEMIPLFGYMWNSFYKNFNNVKGKAFVRFNPEISINEDFDYNIRFLRNVQRMQGIDFCAYHYAKRVNNSMSTRKNDMYLEDHIRKISSFISLYGSVDAMSKVTKRDVFWLYTRYVYSALERTLDDGTRNKLWNDIRSSCLFLLFENTSFEKMSIKIQIMTTILKLKNVTIITWFVRAITVTKKYAPILFSLIKR